MIEAAAPFVLLAVLLASIRAALAIHRTT